MNTSDLIKSWIEQANHHKMALVTLILTLCLTPLSALAADWPLFRNDASNAGASAETINLPLTLQWHSIAPIVEENGVVVSKGVAYMVSNNGQLHAFHVSTGFEVAGFPVATAVNNGTPAVDALNGHVYVLAGSTLWAFNLNGTPAWNKAVGSTGTNFSQGPVIDAGFIYLAADGKIQKYNAAGTLQWSTLSSGGNNVQPAVMGGFIYSNTQSGQIRKFDKVTGVEVIGGGFPITTTSQQASLTAINGKIFFKSTLLFAYNAGTGALVWSQPIGPNATYYNSPAVAGGAVYVYGWDAKLYAFDEMTGVPKVGFPSVALSNPNDRNWSSPAVAGDKVFVGAGTSQKLKVLGAAGSALAGQVLPFGEYDTFSTDRQGFDLCSPAVSDCFVFAMLDGGGLYAFFGGGSCGTPPKGALTINGGANCTESQTVTLTLDNNNDPNVIEMRISEDPLFVGVTFVPYLKTSSFSLSTGFGTKTVYAQLRDNKSVVSNVFSDQIQYALSCRKNVCDVDGDGDIDKLDLAAISKARGTIALPGDPRDANRDGVISAADVKVCTPLCTRPNCATR